MIIDAVSDLHGFYPKLEGGDLLIVAGDLTAKDTFEQHIDFKTWLHKQNYRKKIVIAGNHDNHFMGLPSDPYVFSSFNTATGEQLSYADYLCNSGTEFEGLKIWGTPHSLWFSRINPKCAAFTGSEEDLKKRYDLIPNDIDILVTHSPPYGILDQNVQGEYCGSKSLLETIHRINPSLVVYGHIHEFGLRKKIENDILFVNSSFVDERYKPRNGFMKCHYQDSLFTACSTLTLMK